GAPPGYVGYDEGGYLTEAVRRRPYSVILFDEIEKAHPDVFNVLLQILDDGRLTDGKGRTVDFRNSIIILTSNIGSQMIYDAGDKDTEELKPELLSILQQYFRPEFINRLDDIIVFHRLDSKHILRIVEIRLNELLERLAGQNFKLSVSESLKAHFGAVGYDPQFGARPLKRIIQKELEDFLARRILSGDLKTNTEYLLDYDESRGLVCEMIERR
ncbi:MAG: AAA family ATPase, partial [Candidatus Cloacimonadaceae bacterium]|nr:AAA family ATPase [Candidatus Cloacimonadaceae bacterium]